MTCPGSHSEALALQPPAQKAVLLGWVLYTGMRGSNFQGKEVWPGLGQTERWGLLGTRPCQVWSGLSPAALTCGTTGIQALLFQPLVAAFPAHFSDLPMESALEWVPAAQGARSKTQVGHCVPICILTGLLGALNGGEP